MQLILFVWTWCFQSLVCHGPGSDPVFCVYGFICGFQFVFILIPRIEVSVIVAFPVFLVQSVLSPCCLRLHSQSPSLRQLCVFVNVSALLFSLWVVCFHLISPSCISLALCFPLSCCTTSCAVSLAAFVVSILVPHF